MYMHTYISIYIYMYLHRLTKFMLYVIQHETTCKSAKNNTCYFTDTAFKGLQFVNLVHKEQE